MFLQLNKSFTSFFVICIIFISKQQLSYGFNQINSKNFIQINDLLNKFDAKYLNNSNNDNVTTIQIKQQSTRQGYDDQICLLQFMAFLNGVNSTEYWAIRVADAWGKLPSGILSGNLYEFGSFDQCLDIQHKLNDENNLPGIDYGDNQFIGQYCLSQIKIYTDRQNMRLLPDLNYKIPDIVFKGMNTRMMLPSIDQSINLNVGACVPSTCSPQMVGFIVETILEQLNITRGTATISQDNCYSKINNNINFEPIDIFAIVFFALFGILMVLSTIYDLTMTYLYQTKKKYLALISFSMYTNGKKLFQLKSSNNSSDDVLDCLNGIRVLSILWVVFGHTYTMFAIGPLVNAIDLLGWVKNYFSMFIMSATVSVDSFFLLSGLLVTWSMLKYLDKSSGKINIAWLYLHRYIRLTPALGAGILLSVTVFRYFGDGPMWNTYMNIVQAPCKKYWWSAFLYIQNYLNPSEICFSHSWYLSVDMQLYILSPFILVPLWKFKTKVLCLIPIIILASMVTTFTLFIVYGFSNQLVENMLGGKRMELTYYPTHTRMGVWFVGVILGYILHNLRGKTLSLSKIWISIGWLVSIATILAVIFGNYPIQQPSHNTTVLDCATYESLSRVGWSLGLSWIIFACVHGYGGLINEFLSLSFWQPLAKLSYSIYIIHLPIQVVLTATKRLPTYFTDTGAITAFWGYLGITLTVSIFWTMAFESPILAIEKLLLKKSKPIENNNQLTDCHTSSQEELIRQSNCDLINSSSSSNNINSSSVVVNNLLKNDSDIHINNDLNRNTKDN